MGTGIATKTKTATTRKQQVTKAGLGDKKKFERERIDYSSAQFEEIESYPVIEPYAYVRILFNKKTYTKVYHVVEPELVEAERDAIKKIEDVLTRSLTVRIEELDEDPVSYLRRATAQVIKEYSLPIHPRAQDKIFYYIRRDLLGYGLVDVFMNDPNIEDISCDGPFLSVYIYDRRYESLQTTIMWDDEAELDNYVIRLAQRCDKHISMAEPLLDSTLMDGSRAVMTLGREISTRGSTFTIRKFREEPFTPSDLIDFNTMSSLIVAYFWLAIQYGMSMLICGGTASGKTTSLNALALFIQQDMKVVSIEETRELNLPHPNWIPGLTREGFGGEAMDATGKRAGEVNMYDLLRAALRERPEYIIVGEIRGAEAYVLFQAMATGHTTYSTVHADSVPSLVHRLENKPIDIPRVMIPSLDAVSIQIQTRIAGRRVRRVKQVVEIIGLDPHTTELLTNEVFRWIPATDEYEFSGKSYVLEKIMVKANMSKQQIMQELMSRKEVLEWMVENKVRKHTDVSKIIAEYYLRPEQVLTRVRGGTGRRQAAPPAVSISQPKLGAAGARPAAPRPPALNPPQGQQPPPPPSFKANLQQAALPPAGGGVRSCPTCMMPLAPNVTQCSNCGEKLK
jgi:flagellar protein FlaI